jgi:hypothetical protein
MFGVKQQQTEESIKYIACLHYQREVTLLGWSWIIQAGARVRSQVESGRNFDSGQSGIRVDFLLALYFPLQIFHSTKLPFLS